MKHADTRAGYWCEWLTADESGAIHCVESLAVGTAAEAAHWARIGLAIIGTVLGEPASSYRWDLLAGGSHDIEKVLEAGEVYSFAVSAAGSRFEWRARPVVFLPLATAWDCVGAVVGTDAQGACCR